MVGPLCAAVGGCAAAAVVLVADPTTPGGPLPVCPTRALLGLDCPLCGGLRMTYLVLHGDLAGALHANAVALALVALLGWSWLAWTLGRWRGRPVADWRTSRGARFALVAVLFAWLVVRNLPFAPVSALHV